MLCEVAIFCKSDEDPAEFFPHELSAWADGGPVDYYRNVDSLTQQKYTGVEQTRTVTTEGLQPPVHGFLNVQPPKYPPAKLTGYRCDHSIIADVDAEAKLLVYAIDTVLMDSFGGEAGLIAITPAENQDQVTAALANWRAANPLGTAREFAIVLRTFTS